MESSASASLFQAKTKAVEAGYLCVIYFEYLMFCELGGLHRRVIEDCGPEEWNCR